jgi:hypothetical protein
MIILFLQNRVHFLYCATESLLYALGTVQQISRHRCLLDTLVTVSLLFGSSTVNEGLKSVTVPISNVFEYTR